MKKIILMIGLLIGLSSLGFAQCKKSCKSSCDKGIGMQVPFSAKSTFDKMHPDAQKVKWKREDGNYEATYVKDGKEVSVVINKNGKVLEEEFEIDAKDLPSKAAKYLKKNHENATIDGVERIVKEGKTYYEVELKEGAKSVELLFDEDGKLIEE